MSEYKGILNEGNCVVCDAPLSAQGSQICYFCEHAKNLKNIEEENGE